MEYKHSNYYCLDEDEVNIKNTNKTNTSFPECDVIIGYSENGYVPAVFLVLSVIGLLNNMKIYALAYQFYIYLFLLSNLFS